MYTPVSAYSNAPTDSTAHAYWVTRVVRSMKGCSPARIDSVIQANLPPRKIRWSQRPDTLEIPGLKGRIPYSADNIPKCYELGFFRDNRFLHPELTVGERGIPSDIRPYHLSNDSNIIAIMVICFLALSLIIHHSRKFIAHQAHAFFQPPSYQNKYINEETSLDAVSYLTAVIVLGCMGCILYMYYVQNAFNLFLCYLPQYALLGIYSTVAVTFLILKNLLAAFINWIFFSKNNRQEWRQSYNYLLLLETTVLMPVVAGCIFSRLSPENIIIYALLIVGMFKLALLYKTFRTFSFRIYGLLHLLSYLCALEIIPLLLLWVVLGRITNSLTITF